MANANARYAYNYLMERYRLKPHQAAGVVGNLIQESSMNTGARNRGDGSDGSDSIGIAQWNGKRARGLHDFAKQRGAGVGDLNTQLDYMMHELQSGDEQGAFKRLMASSDVDGATRAMIGYERPQGWSLDNPTAGHGWNNRVKHARNMLGLRSEDLQGAQPVSNDLAIASVNLNDATNTNNGKIQQVNAGNETEPQERKRLLDFDILPEEIGGIKKDDIAGGFGELAKAFTEQDDEFNQQAAQTGGLLGGSGPIQLNLLNSLGTTEEEKKKMKPWELQMAMLTRRGGLGGLGGVRGLM